MRWLKDLFAEGRELAGREYPDARERDSLLNTLLEDVLHFPRYASLTDPFREVDSRDCDLFLDCARRLAGGEPVQYIIGWTGFCGRRFKVTPAVLIPRPETEQLCLEAVARIRGTFHPDAGSGCAGGRPLRILDLCTGSGCIAWTLALELPGAEVVGVDISGAALDIASGQELLRGVAEASPDVHTAPGAPSGVRPVDETPAVVFPAAEAPEFVEYDVLKGPAGFSRGVFDVIVSNPPYVRECERPMMRRNVIEHEPALALFVPDCDPLKFYRAIRGWAESLLVPGGLLFLEQNEYLSGGTDALFSDFPEHGTFSDCFGKQRFTFARK